MVITRIKTQITRHVNRDFKSVNHECSHTQSTVEARIILSTVSSIRLTRKTILTNVKKPKPLCLTLHCFDQFIMFHSRTSWRWLSVLQWFPTALRMIFTFLQIVFEFLFMFYRLYLSHLRPFFPLLPWLRPYDPPTISSAQKILPQNCSCYSFFWNNFPKLFSYLAPSQCLRPWWSLHQPLYSKESHPL